MCSDYVTNAWGLLVWGIILYNEKIMNIIFSSTGHPYLLMVIGTGDSIAKQHGSKAQCHVTMPIYNCRSSKAWTDIKQLSFKIWLASGIELQQNTAHGW